MTFLQYILWMVLAIGVTIIVWMVLFDILERPLKAEAQNATIPKPVVSPPNPTPTAPVPNFQYLPQKAFVYSFAPENGIPLQPLQPLPTTPTVSAPQPVVATPAQAATPTPALPINEIVQYASVAGAALLAKMGFDKGKKAQVKTAEVEYLTKENMAAILQDKEIGKELARVMFKFNPELANKLDDAPAIKLENLEKDKAEFADKAANA